jgi:hypothetical protein
MYASKISGKKYFIKDLGNPSQHSSKKYFENIFKKWKEDYSDTTINTDIVEWNGEWRTGINSVQGNICLKGYFQRWEYIESVKEEFLSKLSFDESVLSRHPDISKKFFIHVRGGDYVNHSFHDVGLKSYYQKCLELCEGEELVVFTNDVPYAESVMPGYDIIQESEIDTLLLMSKCKGCICVNSSFSWWGAYLNHNRPIYIPNKWFTSGSMDISGYCFEGCRVINV